MRRAKLSPQVRAQIAQACLELADRTEIVELPQCEETDSRCSPILLGYQGLLSSNPNKTVLIWEPFIDALVSGHDLTSIWAFVNAGQQVMLTDASWRDAQLMPFRRPVRHFLPPITLPPLPNAQCKTILLLNHTGRPEELDRLSFVAERCGYALCSASSSEGLDFAEPPIHLHFGAHSLFSAPIRIVDSWASSRVAIQLDLPRTGTAAVAPDAVNVDPGQNGILIRTVSELEPVLRKLDNDKLLFEEITARACAEAQELRASWIETMRAFLG